jgi:hypothetical protein
MLAFFTFYFFLFSIKIWIVNKLLHIFKILVTIHYMSFEILTLGPPT